MGEGLTLLQDPGGGLVGLLVDWWACWSGTPPMRCTPCTARSTPHAHMAIACVSSGGEGSSCRAGLRWEGAPARTRVSGFSEACPDARQGRAGQAEGPVRCKTDGTLVLPKGTVMAWCPNCEVKGGKGKSHNQFAHLGGGLCGRYSLSAPPAPALSCRG